MKIFSVNEGRFCSDYRILQLRNSNLLAVEKFSTVICIVNLPGIQKVIEYRYFFYVTNWSIEVIRANIDILAMKKVFSVYNTEKFPLVNNLNCQKKIIDRSGLVCRTRLRIYHYIKKFF